MTDQQILAEPSASRLRPLEPAQLRRITDLSHVDFNTTDDLSPVDGFAGQVRALDAIRFGSAIRKSGFNLFVIGSPELSMQKAVEAILRSQPPGKTGVFDWVYVNNFADAHKPVAIRLPIGRAPGFCAAMRELIEDLKSVLPGAFQGEEYQTRRGVIEEAFQKKQADAFAELGAKAQAKELLFLRTPMGFAFAPARDGQVVPPEEFGKWEEARRAETREAMRALEKELEHVVRQIPSWDKARRDEIRELNRDTAKLAIGQLIDETQTKFADLPQVGSHLEAVRQDLIENVGMFVMHNGEEEEIGPMTTGSGSPFDRYEVNLLVTQEKSAEQVPIVYELHPTLSNVTGRVEYLSRQGALVTNFRMIKPGAIHRANGGYLLVDARNLLIEPFVWVALKRAIKRGEIIIEDANRLLGLTSTVTLEPDPIPLDLKVVLFGDRLLYYLLSAYDPEVSELFKVLADFDDEFERSHDSEAMFAHLVAQIARDNKVRPLGREAVGLVIEQAARIASHAGKLTLLVDRIRDVIIEADFRASIASRERIERTDVEEAIDQQVRRASRIRDLGLEAMLQEVSLIDTSGRCVGQVNGLSVISLGGTAFGRPSRITCRVRPGGGHVVDIERETKLGGPLHSKGVLILSGFLAGRYALEAPMSLAASLVFEQSYGGVEGDSASSAELYALISSLSGIPLRQDIAVTGSVNQHGQVQAIGGVNEKIEGFFDICKARGLTGSQGVAIPKANVQHLMLRKDVVDACANGQFAIYAVATIDEGVALLTGVAAGDRTAEGNFPPGSINAAVEQTLQHFASVLQRYGARAGEPAAAKSEEESE